MCTENTSERRSAPHRFACDATHDCGQCTLYVIALVMLSHYVQSGSDWFQELCNAVLSNMLTSILIHMQVLIHTQRLMDMQSC